jgi:heme O synthase-like polyprenyltransferase
MWMAALTFLAYIGQYTFVFWFPTMLKRLTGFTDMRVGMVGALPFLVGFVAMQVKLCDLPRSALSRLALWRREHARRMPTGRDLPEVLPTWLVLNRRYRHLPLRLG